MKITVTREHIDQGVRRNSRRCMIADAVKTAHPRAQYVLVDLQSIRWSDPKTGERYTYLTPPLAQHNLLRFDSGDAAIQPFTFSLRTPQVRAMGWEGQRSKGSSRKGKRYRKTGKQRPAVAYKERAFGLRQFAR